MDCCVPELGETRGCADVCSNSSSDTSGIAVVRYDMDRHYILRSGLSEYFMVNVRKDPSQVQNTKYIMQCTRLVFACGLYQSPSNANSYTCE